MSIDNGDAWNALRNMGGQSRHHLSPRSTYVLSDALEWLHALPAQSVHAVVTDPPYGTMEYGDTDHAKLRAGRGGVWRIPPSFDGARRRPLPRFTVMDAQDRVRMRTHMLALGQAILHALVPGGHVIMAANPLMSSLVFTAMEDAGFEKRGEVVRLVQTLRGGDRPKGAEAEFSDVSSMPRACWEPWGVFRKPLSERTVAGNLRRWGTGGLRRISEGEPFKDVIACSPTRGRERVIAPHPSLKPQRFMRRVVRAALPLGTGIVHDPFAGSGSTLAAAEHLGYFAMGTERDAAYMDLAVNAFHDLSTLDIRSAG